MSEKKRRSQKSDDALKSLVGGLTIVELLMLLLLLTVVGAVLTPQFLDFRHEGRSDAIRRALYSVRMGVQLQRSKAILRCGAAKDYYPSLEALVSNDLSVDEPCSAYEGLSLKDKKFFEEESFPENPFNASASVLEGEEKGCAQVKGPDGWRYNARTGEFWANSLTIGVEECDF